MAGTSVIQGLSNHLRLYKLLGRRGSSPRVSSANPCPIEATVQIDKVNADIAFIQCEVQARIVWKTNPRNK